MTQLTWGVPGVRFFESGVDRGVLYVNSAGVPWNGLISIDEAPSGGDPRSYYLDGVKYLQRSQREEYAATLNAFYSPPEFDECDGTGILGLGLFAGQQKRSSFGLSYRTRLGNDLEGADHGYKIHMVYNAMAAPTQKTYATIGSEAEADSLSWSLTTKPVRIPGFAHSAHLWVDTTRSDEHLITLLENILYGTESEEPRLPNPAELVSIFDSPLGLVITEHGDGSFTASGPSTKVMMLDDTTFRIVSDEAVPIDDTSYSLSSE